MIVQIPLVRPTHPGYFRWQRYTTAAKLPGEIRSAVVPLQPGESYYLALGGSSGFSGGSIQYPPRQQSGPYEAAIGEEREDGLLVSRVFLMDSWVPDEFMDGFKHWLSIGCSVRVTCGRYNTNASGAETWETRVDKTVPSDEALTIPESDLVGCTHLRLSDAKIRPILVVRATSTPAWEPIFIAPLCVVEIE